MQLPSRAIAVLLAVLSLVVLPLSKTQSQDGIPLERQIPGLWAGAGASGLAGPAATAAPGSNPNYLPLRKECAPGCEKNGNCNIEEGRCECPWGHMGACAGLGMCLRGCADLYRRPSLLRSALQPCAGTASLRDV